MEFINKPNALNHFDSDNVDDLIMFRKAFDFKEMDRESLQKRLKKVFDENKDKSQEELLKLQVDFTFSIIPDYFMPEQALGWKSLFVFHIDSMGDYILSIKNGKAEYIKENTEIVPTCNVYTDLTTLTTQLCRIRLEDLSDSDELSDTELEYVAGGKTTCGAEASGGGHCGGDVCGAAACGGVECGGAACSAAGCGGAACGAAACHSDVCGGAACGVAAGVGGACAGNLCGVDVGAGSDVGPCGINLIPNCPFI